MGQIIFESINLIIVLKPGNYLFKITHPVVNSWHAWFSLKQHGILENELSIEVL